MGKAARFACILTPMVCTLISLVCAFILVIAGTNKNLHGLQGLYWAKINTQNIHTTAALDLIPGSSEDPQLRTGFSNATAAELGLQDFYQSYLWAYCDGSINDKDNSTSVKSCSKPKTSYAFDIISIVHDNAKTNVTFPGAVTKVQKSINVVSKVMIVCYMLGFVATVVTFCVGWLGLLSRWGSCITTIFAEIAFTFFLIASIASTALVFALDAAYHKVGKDFGVVFTVGSPWLRVTWVMTFFAFCAGIFWTFSMCCCSGRTSRVMGTNHHEKKGGAKVVHAPYTYERVASPYLGASGNGHGAAVPMEPYGQHGHNEKPGHVDPHKHGFEPMRHT